MTTIQMTPRALLLFVVTLGVACNSANTQPAAVSQASSRPACDAIDHACDAHEDKGGLAKECHDLGESPKTAEATCVARKAECLAACPQK